MALPHDYMQSALALAEEGRYTTSPNPMVGCVIVKEDRVIGQGFHVYAGGPHAEIIALQEASGEAMGATAYITLEPCCHHGRTPPCTQALIQAGIKEVYVACPDPNPKVAGKGLDALRAANITVNVGLCEEEAKQLNEVFFHAMRHQRPFVIAKWAMSLDGKTVTHQDDARDISSRASQHIAHDVRQQVDAIIIGAKTAKKDNPLLTARWSSQERAFTKHPLRLILASRGLLPFDLNLFDPSLPANTWVVTTPRVDATWYKQAMEKNITVVIVKENQQGQVDLPSLLDELGKQGFISVLVEGGMTVLENMIAEQLVDQFHVYLAPVIIGNLTKKQRVMVMNVSRHDTDFYFTATPEKTTHV